MTSGRIWLITLVTSACMVLGACSTESELPELTVESASTADTTGQPDSSPTAVGLPTALPGPTAGPAAPACSAVPTFAAADTVAIACADRFAVSPELFASNAGWHLFEAADGQWTEIDYALTCCGADEVPFTQLLIRNGVGAPAIATLCEASLVGPDSLTGCQTGRQDGLDIETSWLRVNGFGDHDFGATQTAVLESTEFVFGLAEVGFNGECGAGPMRIASFNDFTLQFQDDLFVGWYYVSSTPSLTTPSGVAPGIGESALTQVYQGLEIFDETLGKEFFFTVPAGSIGGFFDENDSTVQSLYAGTTCFFR